MKVELGFRKSVQENAAAYYEESKKCRGKADRAEKAAQETEKKLKELEKDISAEKEKPAAKIRVKKEKEWFEKFHWFKTSKGRLCVAGRDARQNEVLAGKHLQEGDLFFHAEIHGAPATILKEGAKAGAEEKKEVAQFSGSYSSAWKLGTATVDVYAVTPSQVSKRTEAGESAGKGGFIIRGEREWFKNTELGLALRVGERGVEIAPLQQLKAQPHLVAVIPGDTEKGEAAKKIAGMLGDASLVDEVLQALPAGKFALPTR